MKSLLFTCCLLALDGQAEAQVPDNAPWCPQGATWTYRYFSMTSQSYYRFDYTADTVINGFTSKKLSRTGIFFIAPVPGYPPIVSHAGQEYFRQSNDSIFWWNNGQFQFIYNFAAQVGDNWVTSNSRSTCTTPGFPLQDTLRVRGLKKDTLNGRIYTRILASSDSGYFYTGPVLRNIGSLLSPYPLMDEGKCFLMSHPGAAYDNGSYTELLCYSDNIRGSVPLYNNGVVNPNCPMLSSYFVTAVSNRELDTHGWKAGPNPARDRIQVFGAGARARYRITDLNGRLLASGAVLDGYVQTTMLSPGIYLLHIDSKGQSAVLKLLKQ
jgi:hypothetical protein